MFIDGGAILELIKRNDEQAFKQLFYQFYPRLLRYAFRYVNDKDVAEDLIQDCFLNFWERRNTFESSSVSSLLFCMVRNSCLNYLKHQSLIDNISIDSIYDNYGEERLYSSDMMETPDEIILRKELMSLFHKAVSMLSERTREVFILSRFHGLKNREIADRLGISVKAVEKHISKSMKIISSFWEKQSLDTLFVISLLFGNHIL